MKRFMGSCRKKSGYSGAEGVIRWNAGAAGVGPGVYIGRISAGEFSEAVKFVVAK